MENQHKIRKVKINDLNKYIDNANKAGGKAAAMFHNAAFACVERAATNGDIRPANRLLSGMHASARKNAMIAYFVKVGPFLYDKEAKNLSIDPSAKASGNEYVADLTAAWEKPYWEYTAGEGKGVQPFDFDQALATLIARAEKRLEDPKEGDKIDTSLLKKLKALRPAPAKVDSKTKVTTEKVNGKEVKVTKVKARKAKAA